MSSLSLRGFAALMVAFALFVTSCAHSSQPSIASRSAGKSNAVSGVQSPAPPKQAPAVEGSAQSDAAKPEAKFSLPDGWEHVAKDQLRPGHDFALVSTESESIMFGHVTTEIAGPPGLYVAFRGEHGIAQGFEIGSPVLSEDGSWGMISMKKDDKYISYGMKIVPTTPPHAVFIFGISPVTTSAKLDAVMVSVLESLSLAPPTK